MSNSKGSSAIDPRYRGYWSHWGQALDTFNSSMNEAEVQRIFERLRASARAGYLTHESVDLIEQQIRRFEQVQIEARTRRATEDDPAIDVAAHTVDDGESVAESLPKVKKPRRRRRTKAEMAAARARGEVPPKGAGKTGTRRRRVGKIVRTAV